MWFYRMPVPPENEDVLLGHHAALEEACHLLGDGAEAHQILGGEPPLGEFTNGDAGARSARGRMMAFDARAVFEAGVDQR